MKNWFLSLEDKLIDFLTAICWWLDLHFNIKSRWVADVSFVSVYLAYNQLTSLNIRPNLLILEILLCLYVFLMNNLFLSKLYENSVLSPNPNRHDNFKPLVLILFLLHIVIYFTLHSLAIPVSLLFWYYILCVEPMPPEEKVRRKERNEMSKMKLSEPT